MANTVIRVAPQAQYGRQAGGAEKSRDEFWKQETANDGQQAAVQQGMTTAAQQANHGVPMQVTQDQGLANNASSGAGGNQNQAVSLAGQLAAGNSPSQGAYQLQNGLNQGLAQQTSMGRSARGGAALATAGADAGANAAAMQQNAWTAGGMLRSQDMAQGRGMLGSALGQQRDQDNAQIAEGNSVNQANAQNQDNLRLGMGTASVALGQVGNAQASQDQGVHQAGMGSVDAQDTANQQYKRWQADAQHQKVAANIKNG